jgi:hypothetical protein
MFNMLIIKLPNLPLVLKNSSPFRSNEKKSMLDENLKKQNSFQRKENFNSPIMPSYISLKSFNNMNSYVKNSFRKNITGRKNSHYTYSTHRKNEPLNNSVRHAKQKSEIN